MMRYMPTCLLFGALKNISIRGDCPQSSVVITWCRLVRCLAQLDLTYSVLSHTIWLTALADYDVRRRKSLSSGDSWRVVAILFILSEYTVCIMTPFRPGINCNFMWMYRCGTVNIRVCSCYMCWHLLCLRTVLSSQYEHPAESCYRLLQYLNSPSWLWFCLLGQR